jgi:hypothetical protein
VVFWTGCVRQSVFIYFVVVEEYTSASLFVISPDQLMQINLRVDQCQPQLRCPTSPLPTLELMPCRSAEFSV